MNEIKEIGVLTLDYRGKTQKFYLFFNTYDKSLYYSNYTIENENFSSPSVTDIILDEEIEYFEENATLIEEIEVPHKKYNDQDYQAELVFYSENLKRFIKTRYTQRHDNYYNVLEQYFNFYVPTNLTGGII